jgi:hypothetical protein
MNTYFPHCLLHPSARLTGKSSWTTPFLAYQLHPSFDFCLVRWSILFWTSRRNDTFVLRREQDTCLDCIAKHVSFRSSHRFVDVINCLTHAGNLSTEISCFKKIVVHIQRTCSLVRNYLHVQKHKRRLSHATFFLSEQISWLTVNKKKFPPTEGFLFTSNSKAVLQGMVCKIWVRVSFLLPHAILCLLHLIGGNHNHSDKKRRHTTIRTERGA